MQQRRLRLGDILDDYCPRERRITNHVVVAMIDENVKQTRCSTCDADHEYKQGKAPSTRRRKPDAALAGDIEGALRPRTAVEDAEIDAEADADTGGQELDDEIAPGESFEVPMLAADSDADADSESTDLDADEDDNAGNRASDDDGPVHRRLIRATLPRQEGQVPERKATDFTVRQPGSGRGGGGGREFDGNKPTYRPSGGGPGGAGGGRGPRRPMRAQGGPPGGPARFGGPRPGSGQGGPGQGGQRPGNRPGQPGANRGGGRPPGQGRGPGPGGSGGPGGGGGRKRGR